MSMPAVVTFNPARTDMTLPDLAELKDLSAIHDVQVDGGSLRALVYDAVEDLPVSARTAHAQALFELTDDGYIVEEPESGMYGLGDTADEAFRDMVYALLEYRDLLMKEVPNITPRLGRHLQRLLTVLGPPK